MKSISEFKQWVYKPNGDYEWFVVNQPNDGDGYTSRKISLKSISNYIIGNKQVEITFNLWGGKIDGSTDNPRITIKKGHSIDEEQFPTDPTIEEPNYGHVMFDGWYTEPEGGGTKVDSTTTFLKNTTLYAYWKYYILYQKVGNIAIENGVASGFSDGTNYLESAAPIPYTAPDFEIVMCATTGDDIDNLQTVYGSKSKDLDFEFGIRNKHPSFPIQDGEVEADFTIKANTTYFFKYQKRQGLTDFYIDCFVSEDQSDFGASLRTKQLDTSTVQLYDAPFIIGQDWDTWANDGNFREYWRGTIDMSKSYIKVYGHKYHLLYDEDFAGRDVFPNVQELTNYYTPSWNANAGRSNIAIDFTGNPKSQYPERKRFYKIVLNDPRNDGHGTGEFTVFWITHLSIQTPQDSGYVLFGSNQWIKVSTNPYEDYSNAQNALRSKEVTIYYP